MESPKEKTHPSGPTNVWSNSIWGIESTKKNTKFINYEKEKKNCRGELTIEK